MPPAAFAGVWAKIDWAKRHLSRFPGLETQLRASNPGLIAARDDVSSRQRHYYLTRDPVIPVEYQLLTGDVLQSFRCALDHTAFAVCVAGPAGKAAADAAVKSIQFPITKGSKTDYLALKAREILIKLAKPGIESVIDSIEPYKGGSADLLSSLGELNNIDKHRLLMTVALQVPAVDIGNLMLEMMRKQFPERMQGFAPGSMTLFINPADKSPLKAGDVIYSEPLEGEHHVPTFSFPIALNEPAIVPVQKISELLERMLKIVTDTVPQFDSFV